MKEAFALTDEQWESIRPYLEHSNGHGNRRTNEIRQVIDAILYYLVTRISWRTLPCHFPHWKGVSSYYYRLRKKGTWDQIPKTLGIRGIGNKRDPGKKLSAKSKQEKHRPEVEEESEPEKRTTGKRGNYDNNAESLRAWVKKNGNGKAVEAVKKKADRFCLEICRIIGTFPSSDTKSFTAIALRLSNEEIPTARKKKNWSVKAVKNILERGARLTNESRF